MTNKVRNTYYRLIVYTILGILFFAYWEHSAINNSKTRLLLSSPSLILEYFTENYESILKATYITFIEAISGLSIASFFALFTVTICLIFPKLMNYVLPVMIASQVIPLITLAPFLIMVFGIGLGSKIMMAALISFFPIFVNFASGVKLISNNIHDLMNIHNASIIQKIRMVYFPLSLPQIFSGLKVAATLSVIGAIVAEFSGAEVGLGRNLYTSALRIEPEMMMTSLTFSVVAGGALYILIVLIEKIFGNWYLKNGSN